MAETTYQRYERIIRADRHGDRSIYDRIARLLLTVSRGRVTRRGDTFYMALRDEVTSEDQRCLHSVIHTVATLEGGGRLLSAGPTFVRVSVPVDPLTVRRGEHTYKP